MTKKIEQLLFKLLIILVPSQLAFHFWPQWSYVQGLPVDYLAPTIYFTDILIAAILILSRRKLSVPIPLIVISVINTAFSVEPVNTLLFWIRVYEYYWLYKHITRQENIKAIFSKYIGISVIWTCILAWMQFQQQHSVGGVWYWLGERTFNAFTPNIAIANPGLDMGRILRAYATFPHPNALAGFLVLAFWLVKSKAVKILAIATVLITFSRTAIFTLAIMTIVKYVPKKLAVIFTLTTVTALLITTNLFDPAIKIRQELNSYALSSIIHFPLLGVGLGNNIVVLPSTSSFLQPVHNIYLLLTSELGIPVVIILCIWLYKKSTPNFIWTAILITGLMDHYWLTLHQNQLLLTMFLGLQAVESKKHE